MKYDLIIAGSGSVGAAAGYYSTRAGLKVLMIDSGVPPHTEGSHHGETRIIRHAYGEGEKYVPMVLRAQHLWEELQQLSGERIFDRTGVISFGPAESDFLRNVSKSALRWNLPLEQFSPEALMQRWPQIRVPSNYIGIFEPNSGVLRSETAVRVYIRLAKEAGCTQLFNSTVTAIHSDSSGVRVECSGKVYKGNKLLLSAGAWVSQLVPHLPVTPVRKVFAWFQADDKFSSSNKFPAFIGELENQDMFYGFPAENGELKIGKHNDGQVISTPDERVDFGEIARDESEALPLLREFLPGVGECIRGASCTYDRSPDEDFIIDNLPGKPNTLIITGLSGHGFKFASVLGEIATQFAEGQVPAFDLTEFSLKRFDS